MIDDIFAAIIKEARSRPGKDMVKKLYTVSMEIGTRLMAVMDQIREEEGREKKDER